MNRTSHPLAAVWLSTTLFVLAGAPASARAEDAPQWNPGDRTTDRLRGEVKPDDRPYIGGVDGVYDRLDGDVTFTLGLGAEIGNGARGSVLGRVLYYHTGGIIAGYADAFGAGSDLERVVFVGGELRPLFLTRWQADAEFGVPVLDLVLDSLSIGAGAYFGAFDGSELGDVSGFEGSLGLGVPLTQSANGFWLEFRGTYRAGLPDGNFGALVLLSLYAPWVSPLVRGP